ncbi:hypothetical protein [Arthrobacter sp. ISL-69]|uniref:hypothetical protein n=1 Tax=Arthrobacter sp. ISL-69 TaxID=2819113 RepID=UPI001BE64F5C|nr:hypothetical protein [Arthrobacter sp. ISL-69]MBT2537258.1 hypothetical protein [Arthrobacter sp. ISL-69]
MSIRRVTEEHARQIILSQCRQFVEDTPAREPGHEWDARLESLAKHLTAETGADIENATADLRELITTFEELQSVDTGTHYRIVLNDALTIDNRPDLRDELNQDLSDELAVVLQISAFRPAKEASVAA